MKRIFYYSGYRLTVFHWQNNECIATYAFNPGEEGIDKFQTYLKATANTPVRILVDLIEEDFKKETIPHVGAADRKAIVRRLIKRQYRKSKDFVQYKVLEREKTGRKDDVLLYSVLSNPEILEPWLKPMQATGTAISGIWSLPLLSPKLFKKLNTQAKNVLLVSQQVPSNLRQTFIRNGRFESSRSAVVNLEDAPLGEYIANEVEQTIRFLSNQRHIGFDEKIEVHIICRQTDISEITSRCIDTGLRSFHYHNITDMEDALNCDTHSAEYTNGIYSYVCARQPLSIGHYGNRKLFSHYYEQLTSKALYVASALLVLLATIFSFSFISESVVLDEEAHTLYQQAIVIDNTYQKNLAQLEPQLKQANLMRSSVLLSDNIKKAYAISPLAFMNRSSRIIDTSHLTDYEITEFNWTLTQAKQLSDNKQKRKKTTQAIDYTKPESLNHLSKISGFVYVSKLGLKSAFNKVDSLQTAFRNQPAVLHVRANKLPVDTRPDASVDLQANTDKSSLDDAGSGQFEIEILMQGNKL